MQINKNKSQLENVWSILCGASSTDKQSNNVSLFNVIEQCNFSISVKENKKKGVDIEKELKNGIAFPLRYFLVTLWSRAKAKTYPEIKTRVLIELLDSQNKVLFKQESDIKFPEGKRRMRCTTEFNQLTITGGGDYMFRTKLKHQSNKDWKQVPLEVKVDFVK